MSLLWLAMATSIAVAPQVFSIAEIQANAKALNQQTVQIRGWLGRCGGLDCMLYPSLSAAHNNGSGGLSVGDGSPAIEATLEANAFTQVIVEARFDSTCLAPRAECVDRPSTFTPIRIERVQTSLLPPQPK